MKCPVCENVNLLMSERQGIEIDYCPQCRGVWLDRGELDKIIDKSAPGAGSPPPAYQGSHDPRGGAYGYQDTHPAGYRKKKKREGFLSDLFDFD